MSKYNLLETIFSFSTLLSRKCPSLNELAGYRACWNHMFIYTWNDQYFQRHLSAVIKFIGQSESVVQNSSTFQAERIRRNGETVQRGD